jgi:hypothetical protein
MEPRELSLLLSRPCMRNDFRHDNDALYIYNPFVKSHTFVIMADETINAPALFLCMAVANHISHIAHLMYSVAL